jgi:O-acetyl-ADP-ribose deacetylase (regulator of RNase III)
MGTIQYIMGDATAPQTARPKIICHVCNDIGGWGKGFVLALSRRWKQPEAAFRQWYGDRENSGFALGAVQFVQVEPDMWVANLVGQHGIRRKGVEPEGGVPPIRYEAVEQGLHKVADEASKLGASVHMPRIGCGLAGGTWDRIEPIIQRTLLAQDVEVFVYDLG